MRLGCTYFSLKITETCQAVQAWNHKLQSWRPAHSSLCLALCFTQLQCRGPSSTPQHCALEAAGLPHSPCSRWSLSKKPISQLQVTIMVPPYLIAHIIALLSPIRSSSLSQRRLREVKIGRPTLQILSWFAPNLHSSHKNNQFLHLCMIRSEPKLLDAAARIHGFSSSSSEQSDIICY